jgi:serine/threonine-protein kinase RIO1
MIGDDRSRMPNSVAGVLKRHDLREEDRREKVKDKSDRATSEQVMDDRTRLVIFKFIKSGFFNQINGCISTGKGTKKKVVCFPSQKTTHRGQCLLL